MSDSDLHHQAPSRAAANDRFKKSFSAWLWGSVLTATALHFAMFMFWPDMTAANVPSDSTETRVVVVPPEIEIPPEPEAISRPAIPVITTADISEDITISPTTFEDNPVETLMQPRDEEAGSLIDAPAITPMTVRPSITNRRELQRALEREYPAMLRDAGIGGTVLIHFFIDEEGTVQRTLVAEASGHVSLDEAALRVAGVARFTPALNLDKVVPVWIQIPITFRAR
ncbi:MAG: energy transducer TonB [Gammaproteobacteria bacterium]|nr:energy transducer TonB [Gammaproteobacteria bacterium]